MNGLSPNSLEIRKMFLKPIKRILKYLPVKVLGVTKTSTPLQAMLYEVGLQWHRWHRHVPPGSGERTAAGSHPSWHPAERSPHYGPTGALGKVRRWPARLVRRRAAGREHSPPQTR